MSNHPEGSLQYHFRNAIAGFFELSTQDAKALLPPVLEPVEPHHGRAVLSVMALDFHASPVGAYGELILSVLVAPRIAPGEPVPRSAFFPFRLGVTTRASREHAIERWRLPHHMQDIEIAWDRSEHGISVHASERGQSILSMRVTDYDWSPAEHRYQAFMHDDGGSFTSTIMMAGEFSETEDERGSLTLRTQPMTDLLVGLDIELCPFRELWMRDGVETFHPLQPIARLAKPTARPR